jgi:hypothetical protein
MFELHQIVTEGTLDSEDATARFRRPGESISVADRGGTSFTCRREQRKDQTG